MLLIVAGWFFLGRGGAPEQVAVTDTGTASAVPSPDEDAAGSVDDTTGPVDGAIGSPDDTPSPTPSDDSAEQERDRQAREVDLLLDDSGAARKRLSRAVTRVGACRGTSEDVAAIREATEARRTQLAQARDLQVDALPDGPDLKDALVDALTASLRADERYLTWAGRYVGGRCATPYDDPDFERAGGHSEAATAAKRDFLRLWNPVAESAGLPTREEGEI